MALKILSVEVGYTSVKLEYEACEESCESVGDKTCGKLVSIALEVRIRIGDYDTVEFPKEKSVTFAHSLESMYAWEKWWNIMVPAEWCERSGNDITICHGLLRIFHWMSNICMQAYSYSSTKCKCKNRDRCNG